MQKSNVLCYSNELSLLLREFVLHVKYTFGNKLVYIGTTVKQNVNLSDLRDVDILLLLQEIDECQVSYLIRIINKLHSKYNILLDARIYSKSEIEKDGLIPIINKYLLRKYLVDLYGDNPFFSFNVQILDIKKNAGEVISHQVQKIVSLIPRIIKNQHQLREISQYVFDALRAYLIIKDNPFASKEDSYNFFISNYPEFDDIKHIYRAYLDPSSVIDISIFIIDCLAFVKHLEYKIHDKKLCNKVLLINSPSSPIPHPRDDYLQFDNNMPLGLVYLASYLKEQNIPVEILDAYAENLGILSTVDKIFNQPQIPKIIGFNSSSPNINIVQKISSYIKRINSEIIIVVGGPHASIAPKHTLSKGVIDFVVIGEGEVPFLNLVNGLFLETSFNQESLPKAVFSKESNLDADYSCDYLNLDFIPYPDFNLLPIKLYFKNKKRLYIHTTRGCSFNCIYCSVPQVWEKVRELPLERLLDHVERLNNEFKPDEYQIVDDNFSHKRGKLIQMFCEGLEKRSLQLKWKCQVRADQITHELIQLMSHTGCFEIDFGIESGNPEIQKYIRKGLNLDKTLEVVASAGQNNIFTKAFLMVGFPPEDYSHIQDTINYSIELKKNGLKDVAYFPVMPFPGTEISKITRKEVFQGAIIDDIIFRESSFSNFRLRKYSARPEISLNENFSPEELRFLVKFAYQRFNMSAVVDDLKIEFEEFISTEEKELYGI